MNLATDSLQHAPGPFPPHFEEGQKILDQAQTQLAVDHEYPMLTHMQVTPLGYG